MKKTYQLQDLDCANCAAKMQDAVAKIDGVNMVSISFLTQKMILDADDANYEKILKETVKVCRKIEPDCTIII